MKTKPPEVVDAEFEPVTSPLAKFEPGPVHPGKVSLYDPEVEGPVALVPVTTPAAPAGDPVTTYLSRYTSAHSRAAMLSSLRIVARMLTGREVDPRAVPWTEVRYAHVQEVRHKLSLDGYSWASTNRHLLALRGIVKECWRLGLTPQDVYLRVAEVESLKSDQRETGRALSAEELAKLFAACDDSLGGLRDRAVVTLAAFAGMRRSELCGVQVSNWTPAERKLHFVGKGNKWRTVYLSEKHAKTVESWLDVRQRWEGPLLLTVSKHGVVMARGLSAAGMYRVLLDIGARAKLEAFTPHDLRRTFITRLLEKGADALTVSKLAGHNSVQTTLGYDKRGEKTKQAASELLDD